MKIMVIVFNFIYLFAGLTYGETGPTEGIGGVGLPPSGYRRPFTGGPSIYKPPPPLPNPLPPLLCSNGCLCTGNPTPNGVDCIPEKCVTPFSVDVTYKDCAIVGNDCILVDVTVSARLNCGLPPCRPTHQASVANAASCESSRDSEGKVVYCRGNEVRWENIGVACGIEPGREGWKLSGYSCTGLEAEPPCDGECFYKKLEPQYPKLCLDTNPDIQGFCTKTSPKVETTETAIE